MLLSRFLPLAVADSQHSETSDTRSGRQRMLVLMAKEVTTTRASSNSASFPLRRCGFSRQFQNTRARAIAARGSLFPQPAPHYNLQNRSVWTLGAGPRGTWRPLALPHAFGGQCASGTSDAVLEITQTGRRATPVKDLPLSSTTQLAGGQLDLLTWRDNRMMRIWTPPGFSLAAAAREPYPVMYLNDGQNLYDDRLPMSGHSWHAAEAASGLINSGKLPPFVIVGIDHSGAMRPYDYLPYPPGNANGFRLDADKWPGGGVDAYLAAVLDEILPYMERSYGVSPEPSLRGFGGSSFGGICSLCCAMRHPGVFGSFLVESPSLWFGDEKLLKQELPAFQGPWPARLFLAMGTKEYGGVREVQQPAFDAQLVAYTHQLAELLEGKGLTRGQRLQVVVEEGATHNEQAWAGRLPAALRFLGQDWPRRASTSVR